MTIFPPPTQITTSGYIAIPSKEIIATTGYKPSAHTIAVIATATAHTRITRFKRTWKMENATNVVVKK
jgi:ethanolamine utilization microcompartment shell protein EutS